MVALQDAEVGRAGKTLRGSDDLSSALLFGASLARAMGDDAEAELLRSEANGYDDGVDLPEARRVQAFATPFPVRALDLGLLDPEEVFVVNREKFAQVRFAIPQPAGELERLLGQLANGGVLSMRIAASELGTQGAEVDPGAECFLYILPREVQALVERARSMAFRAIIDRLANAAVDGDSEG
jgi:hypothetical protein